MEAQGIAQIPRKVGFLKWEVDVHIKNSVYTFQSLTARKATRRAVKYITTLKESQ